MRKITVVSSDTQSKVTFETEANTVADLLNELDARNIAYAGKALFEGISHSAIETSLLDGILPHGNTYRGTVTDDLVIMITAGKKISSGMDRAVVYEYIKQHNLKQAIAEHFGKNYTNVSTEDLANFIDAHAEANCHAKEDPEDDFCPLEGFLMSCMRVALEHGLISADNVVRVLKDAGCVSVKDDEDKTPSPFSDSEIEDMFKDIVGE